MSNEIIKIGRERVIPGDQFDADAIAFGGNQIKVGGKVEAIRGGGFFGKVILLPRHVIKTAEPDPWHQLWRSVNWALKPFPSQSSELAAQLDYLSGRIINQVIPTATDGRVITPDAIGYVNLGPIGFGQAIERMEGRGARFWPVNENEQFASARQEIWELGVALGLEQAAQVHPDNPFGKPNLWMGENGLIWLDTLPAIKHTGFVLPAFRFGFHQDVREKIGGGEMTFNKIHTDRLRNYGPWPDELHDYLDAYDQTRMEFEFEEQNDNRFLVIEDAVRRGLVSSDGGKRLRRSDAAYLAFLAGTVIKPALGAFGDAIGNTSIYRLFNDSEYQRDMVRLVRDPMFRREKLLENTILRGARQAHELGLIDDNQWREAWKVLDNSSMPDAQMGKLASTYLSLQLWYTLAGNMVNAVSIPWMASSVVAENPGARFAMGLFVDVVLPPVIRVLSTLAVSTMTRQELKTAIMVSALPKVGGYLAVPADMAKRLGDRSEMIWHYTKRGLIASFSKMLRPWGGWNSDLEARIWEGLKVEGW